MRLTEGQEQEKTEGLGLTMFRQEQSSNTDRCGVQLAEGLDLEKPEGLGLPVGKPCIVLLQSFPYFQQEAAHNADGAHFGNGEIPGGTAKGLAM
ncbi:hypothetical protein [Methanoculleus sp.]|uniref:hypothetical protein n=1 Tax=Methanoculleus sp. TaxID=90427 RepID=UPI002FCAE65F